MCELGDVKMAVATKPREWWAVLDRDGYGDVYDDRDEAERNASAFNTYGMASDYAPYRVVHMVEVAA